MGRDTVVALTIAAPGLLLALGVGLALAWQGLVALRDRWRR